MNMKAQLTPYLMSEDARTQAEMYRHVLGGEILSVMTYGQAPGTPEAIKDKVITWQCR
jgi:PhnB protein